MCRPDVCVCVYRRPVPGRAGIGEGARGGGGGGDFAAGARGRVMVMYTFVKHLYYIQRIIGTCVFNSGREEETATGQPWPPQQNIYTHSPVIPPVHRWPPHPHPPLTLQDHTIQIVNSDVNTQTNKEHVRVHHVQRPVVCTPEMELSLRKHGGLKSIERESENCIIEPVWGDEDNRRI